MAFLDKLSQPESISPSLLSKIWIYTNYDCNLSCPYCCAESTPMTSRQQLSQETFEQIVDEAHELGFQQLNITGGEPFLLKNIFEMITYAFKLMPTTVLTNAMLFTRTRLDKLAEIKNDNLTLQVSLDGDKPDIHDAYRGKGSWIKTVAGIRTLKQLGFRVTLATTETPANSSHLPELCQFHQDLGIPEEDHLIRALAKRGYASEGLEVTKMNLSPELTCNLHGVFWHPISTAPDMQVRNQLFPLREALCLVAQELEKTNRTDLLERKEFK